MRVWRCTMSSVRSLEVRQKFPGAEDSGNNILVAGALGQQPGKGTHALHIISRFGKHLHAENGLQPTLAPERIVFGTQGDRDRRQRSERPPLLQLRDYQRALPEDKGS